MHLPSIQQRTTALTIFTAMIIALLIMTGCQNNSPVVTPTRDTVTESPTQIIETQAEFDITADPLEESTQDSPGETSNEETEAVLVEENQPSPSPAPTLNDWRDAPISPEKISDRVLEIYQEGQKQGRDPHSFSVIGDCQSIPFVFMGPYGRGELEPNPAESQLWKAITAFNSSFKRWSVTARGGFTAASLLNPLQADPEVCKPGETPLTCEFRLNNPAFVLITLETWLDPETVDRYEVYLRQILDFVIERGAVPILLTKADSSEKQGDNHVINPVIVQAAYEYQVPVVNFWRSVQYLDNYGIDPDREGFHLSPAGYDLKNTLALRALYQVWTTVEGLEAAGAAEPTPTETPAATPVPELMISSVNCDKGCIFFGTTQSQDGNVVSGGVYTYAPETKTLSQILETGFDLQDVSEDGQLLLVNQANRLYTVDLGNGSSELISDTFYNYGRQGAYWNNDELDIIYLTTAEPLQTGSGIGFNFFDASKDDTLFFESGQCQSKDYCQSEGVFRSDAGGETMLVENFSNPIFSPDGSRVAFLNPQAATADNFFHTRYLVLWDTDTGIASQRVLYFPEVSGFMVYADVETYAFSPDSNQVFILYDVYSEYYEYSLRLQTFLWDLDSGIRHDFGDLEGISGSLSPRLIWSPESSHVLLFITDLTEGGQYNTSIYRTDLETGEHLVLFDEDILTSTDYLYLTNLYWR